METTGIVTQTSFLMKMVFIQPLKDKEGNPMTVKNICAWDHQHVQDLQDQDYTVEIIWQKVWQSLLTHQPDIKSYLSQHCTYAHFKKYLNQDEIIQYIQDGQLFGFVKCDIEVPDHLKNYFSEMTAIFFKIQKSL